LYWPPPVFTLFCLQLAPWRNCVWRFLVCDFYFEKSLIVRCFLLQSWLCSLIVCIPTGKPIWIYIFFSSHFQCRLWGENLPSGFKYGKMCSIEPNTIVAECYIQWTYNGCASAELILDADSYLLEIFIF